MEKVKKLVDKQMDNKMKQETESCLKRIRALEHSLKLHREKLKELYKHKVVSVLGSAGKA